MFSAGAAPPSEEAQLMFLVDDSLSELAKTERYIQSSLPLQRLVYTKNLAACARNVGVPDTLTHLVPLLRKVSTDKEAVVRQALAEQLGPLAELLVSVERGYAVVKDEIIPMLQRLLVDPYQETKAAACGALIQVARVMSDDHVGSIILTMVLCLAHDENDEERVTAVGLLNELADVLGTNLCQNFVVPELASFADDPVFRVRKAAALSFANVCRVVGPEMSKKKLLNSFTKLAHDSIWGVRKGCVESLVAVAREVSVEVRSTVLMPMFEAFAQDPSRWVRNSAFEVLGAFLHALGEPLVTSSFLKWYTKVPTMTSRLIDTDVKFACAYNFPAVVVTLGRRRFHELVEMFGLLTKDTKYQTRRTLSHSLHDIARVLGPELTSRYLTPAFDLFIRDLDEVRVGVITNFARFLAVLPSAKRVEYLEVIKDVAHAEENWRWRELLGRQLHMLVALYPPDLVASSLVPVTLSLCRDRCAAVRKQASNHVGYVIARLGADATTPLEYSTMDADAATDGPPPQAKSLVDELVEFASAPIYMDRQLYIRMCGHILGCVDLTLFTQEFLPALLRLADDKVPNVRLALARFLRDHFLNPRLPQVSLTIPEGESLDRIRSIVDKFQVDKDQDVRVCLSASSSQSQSYMLSTDAASDEKRDDDPQEPDARDIAQQERDIQLVLTIERECVNMPPPDADVPQPSGSESKEASPSETPPFAAQHDPRYEDTDEDYAQPSDPMPQQQFTLTYVTPEEHSDNSETLQHISDHLHGSSQDSGVDVNMAGADGDDTSSKYDNALFSSHETEMDMDGMSSNQSGLAISVSQENDGTHGSVQEPDLTEEDNEEEEDIDTAFAAVLGAAKANLSTDNHTSTATVDSSVDPAAQYGADLSSVHADFRTPLTTHQDDHLE